MSDEQWKPVAGFESAYEVSNRGRVRSISRRLRDGRHLNGRVLRQTVDGGGYARVSLSVDDHVVTALVHSLVLTAFVAERPSELEGRHRDGNPRNNHLENLRWGTGSENTFDQVKHNTHRQARKETCPLGHPLTAPNLVPAHVKRGWRQCLSCNRARALALSQRRPFDPEEAHARYRALPKQQKEAS